MHISVLCYIYLHQSPIPEEFLDQLGRLLDSQDRFCIEYIKKLSGPVHPALSAHRGLAVAEDEDRSGLIVASSMWPSAEACQEWFTSKTGVELVDGMSAFHDAERLDIVMVDGVFIHEEESEENSALMEAQRVEITRWRVNLNDKERFQSAFDALEQQKLKSGKQSNIWSAWQLDSWPARPDSDTIKVFVMIAKCEDDSREDGSVEEKACEDVAISVEKKFWTPTSLGFGPSRKSKL
ncbi:unnamed protein product [Clonostachys byssicola]|uniref:Uncharacterized protein n=1 Tax=Clonostachys byssicola TaxID=160290 RepID=A0A9N9UNS7_9HYPO|nr:unnamed protein product [Clonostachys byssicola]